MNRLFSAEKVDDPTRLSARSGQRIAVALCLLVMHALGGCGTTKTFTATEQLLVSDAIDTTVAKIDFRPLAGHKVFMDNTYLPSQKGVPNPNPSLVHTEYVTSSLRQQMLAAGVYVCEKREEADIIVEPRLGAMGFDGHAITYGLPSSSSISTAASTLSGSPFVPLLPELSLAKKEAKQGAAKLALFAYERQSLQPVWQSGIARAGSSARDTWIFGMGPLQYGTIYEGTRFAGSRVFGRAVGKLVPHEDDEPEALVDYKRSQVFTKLADPNDKKSAVETANATPGQPVTPAGATSPAKDTAPAAPTASAPAAATPPPAAPPANPSSPPAALPTPPPAAATTLHLDDKSKK